MEQIVAEKCPMCGSGSNRVICHRPKLGRQWSLARCRKCRQHFTAPTPTHEELAAFYAGDYHSDVRTTDGTEAAFNSKYDRYVKTLQRHLPSGRVIDVGCSTGLLVKKLRDRGYAAEGIELNAESSAWGRQRYGVTIHNQLLENCPFADESLDALLFTDVLEHTQHPRDYLREAGRKLAPDGLVLVTFPDICSLESRYHYSLSRLLRRDWLWNNCHIPLHVWEFTPASAKACFVSAGFEVLEMHRDQPPAEVADSLALKVLTAPTRCLSWPVLGRLFGTQMEFVIRKVSNSG